MADQISTQSKSGDAQLQQTNNRDQAASIEPTVMLDVTNTHSSIPPHTQTQPRIMLTASEGALKNIEELLQRQLDYVRNSKIQFEPPALTWIESLFPAVIALASFGGSITFSVIPSQLESSHNKRIGDQEIRNFLALAWLFFALALGTASTGQLVLTFHREAIKTRFDNRASKVDGLARAAVWLICSVTISLLLQLLVFAAFLFLALVIAAYAPAVGWTAVGFTSAGSVAAVLVWCLQNSSCIAERKKKVEHKDKDMNPSMKQSRDVEDQMTGEAMGE